MDSGEKYLFDLNGYLLVRGILDPAEVAACLAVADELEGYVAAHIDDEPQRSGYADIRYRFDDRYQFHSYKSQSGGGLQYILDDFLNASPAFDCLVNHPATMDYVRDLASGPYIIGSSELRYRYKSNRTDTHMGGRMDARNRYEFVGQTMFDSEARKWAPRDFNLLAVRFLYALHDVPVENGPLCVVPGSHKSNYFSPYSDLEPTEEPGMVPLPMKAGDCIIFTENLRHGGFPNLMDRSRRTLHLLIAPKWVASQSPIHWNDQVYVSTDAWSRYSDEQRALLPKPDTDAKKLERLHELEVDGLKREIAALKAEVDRLTATPKGLVSSLRKVFRT
jgi:hypothetical protein